MALGFGFDLMSQAVRQRPWTPRFLFGDGEQGAWYDPSDFATLYQDSAGTTPVTALGQPVGLMLDKSQGGKPTGPELVTNGDFSNGTTGWNTTSGTLNEESGRGKLQNSGVSSALSTTTISTVAGKRYIVTAEVQNTTTDSNCRVYAGSTSGGVDLLALNSEIAIDPQAVTLSGMFVASGTSTYISIGNRAINNAIAYYDNISVREIPGNHAAQATAAARPTVQARVNLAEGTDSLTGWANQVNGITRSYPAVTTPNGIPAVLAQLDTSPGWAMETVTAEVSGSHVYSIYVKAGTASATNIGLRNNTTATNLSAITFTFASPSGNYETLGDGWYRIWITGSSISAGDSMGLYWYPGNNVIGASVYGAGGQFEPGSTATTYQRVTTATDYADIGLPRYLEFDGVDDRLNLTGSALAITNDVPALTFIAGARRTKSDAGVQYLIYAEGSSSTRFSLAYLNNQIRVGGRRLDTDSFVTQLIGNAALSAADHVASGIADYANAKLFARANQSEIVVDPFQTAGNTSATDSAEFYLGLGPNPFGGRIYQIIIRNTLTSGTLLNQTERFVARKTGVTL